MKEGGPKNSAVSGMAVLSFLGLNRNTSLLLLALVLAGTGERLWLGFAPKYLTTLGGGVLAIGFFDALQTLLGALYAYPGGWMTDRWGRRKSLLVFNAVSFCGYLLVLFWQHWLALVLGTFLFVAWSALALPATFDVVATSLKKNQHTMGIGLQSMVRRIPMMMGPLAGGWLIEHYGWNQGIRMALFGCLILSALTALFQWFMVDTAPAVNPAEGQLSFLQIVSRFSPTLRELLVSDILIRFCERIPYAFAILWAMDYGHLTAQEYSWLVSFETITAALCYIPVAHLADRYGRRPFVLMTFFFFTLFPLALMGARSFPWLAFAFVIRGLKEFGEPARKALIIAEAPDNLRARTYGAYYLIRDSVVTSGSFLGAWFWKMSPQANFLGAALCGLAGTAWFYFWVYRRRDPASA